MKSKFVSLLEVSGFPQGLKQVSSGTARGAKFVWKELDCWKINGALLGYEVKLYYDEVTGTGRVSESTTTYTIWRPYNSILPMPNAISVAAINEVGVGDHSPPVMIKFSGDQCKALNRKKSCTSRVKRNKYVFHFYTCIYTYSFHFLLYSIPSSNSIQECMYLLVISYVPKYIHLYTCMYISVHIVLIEVSKYIYSTIYSSCKDGVQKIARIA